MLVAGMWKVRNLDGKPVKLEDFEANHPAFNLMKLFETSHILHMNCFAGFLPSTEVS